MVATECWPQMPIRRHLIGFSQFEFSVISAYLSSLPQRRPISRMFIGPTSLVNNNACYQDTFLSICKQYQDMTPDEHGYRGEVILFVNNDVDALCTASILLSLFRERSIETRVMPLTSGLDLDYYLENAKYLDTEKAWREGVAKDPGYNQGRVSVYMSTVL